MQQPLHYLCSVCLELEDVEDFLTLRAFTPSEPETCEGCGKEFSEEGYQIVGITLPEAAVARIQAQIEKCDQDGCGRVPDSEGPDGYILNDTNQSLYELLQELAMDGAIEGEVGRIISDLINAGAWKIVKFPAMECPDCRVQLENWYTEVVVESPIRVIKTPPSLPTDIRTKPVLTPPEEIEYYRSDCSRFLVHLTRANRVAGVYVSNITDEPEDGDLSASEILWVLLQSRRLSASKGKGMYGPAVCFTEKPLVALKDTLLGREFAVRGTSKVLTWAPYGLMFSKEYLRSKGVMPVVCAASRPAGVDGSLFVRLDEDTNWLHEREWRCTTDLDFDTSEAIVLVPHFAQVDQFRVLLDKASIRVRGILPLYDLFAWC